MINMNMWMEDEYVDGGGDNKMNLQDIINNLFFKDRSQRIYHVPVIIGWGMALILLFSMPIQAQNSEPFHIAVVQHQDMDLFTTAFEGFKVGLSELDYTEKVIIDYFNAKNDIKKLDEVCRGYEADKTLDLIFTIGTHGTKTAMKYVNSIPIVFTGVTDPVNAGILDNWKSSGRNLTGIGTPKYITMGIKLLFENLEDPSTLGMIYLAGSPSHEGGIKQVKAFADEAGFKFVSKGFPLRDENGKSYPKEVVRTNLKASLDAVLPHVKLFFVQPSQTFVANFDLFREAFVRYQTFSAGDPMYIKQGIIMGIGRDIQEFGRQAAQYAVEILEGKSPADLPMDTGEQFLIEFNLKAAELVNFAPPILLLAATDVIHKELEIEK